MNSTEIHFCCRIHYEHLLIYSLFWCVLFNVCASNEWVLLWIKLCKMLATINIIIIITQSLSFLLLYVHIDWMLMSVSVWVYVRLCMGWNEVNACDAHCIPQFHPPHFLTHQHTNTLAHVLYGMAPQLHISTYMGLCVRNRFWMLMFHIQKFNCQRDSTVEESKEAGLWWNGNTPTAYTWTWFERRKKTHAHSHLNNKSLSRICDVNEVFYHSEISLCEFVCVCLSLFIYLFIFSLGSLFSSIYWYCARVYVYTLSKAQNISFSTMLLSVLLFWLFLF